jgi:hypothetical protein
MGQESFGPAGEHISRTSDWPKGIEDVLRHPSRVYWNWVNGNEHAYYDGDTDTVNELIDLFAKTDLICHHVIIRPGRPSARSFHGKLTPYTVEFHIPSGIYLHHVRQYAETGLYPMIPWLILHVDNRLAEHLGELKVPSNVTLRGFTHRVEDALAQLDAHDRSMSSRAISVLGDAGDASPPIVEALTQASEDEDEYIRNAAQRAVKQIERANDPEARALRQRIAAFVDNHPQRLRIPKPKELLDTLRRIDAEYAKGFTAIGTMIQPSLSGRGRLVAWTITMGKDRLVLQQRAVEDAHHAPVEGRCENTIFIGPEFMATIQRERIWAEGRLEHTAPHSSFEKPGSTYDLLVGRVLWPLGRGFSRRIDRVIEIAAAADGTLLVTAEGDRTGIKWRWELRIRPDEEFLVRSAKAFRRDQPDPSYIISNAGLMTASDRCVNHTAAWIAGPWAHPISMSVASVSAEPDLDLIRRTEDWLRGQSGRDR